MASRTDADGEDFTRALGLGVITALTVCGWFRLVVDRNTWSTIFSVDNGMGDNWLMQTGSDGVTMNSVFDATTQQSMGAMTVGTWYFICLTTSGTTGFIYYRTAAQSALTSVAVSGATASVNAATLRIGASPWGDEWWSGDSANVCMWTAQLTAAEVLQESTRLVPYRTANLTAWYLPVRPETTDYSGNGRTLSGGSGASYVDGPPIPWYTSAKPRIILPAGAGGSPINVTLNRVMETDTANALTRSKLVAFPRTTSTDTARALTASKSLSLSRATETDVSRTLVASKSVNFSRVTEADTARLLSLSKTVPFLRASETDIARTFTPSRLVNLNRVVETNLARPLTKHTLWILLRATETESTRSLNVAKNVVLNRVVEVDLAQPIGTGQPILVTLNRATETNTARALTYVKQVLLGRVSETDTARSMQIAHHVLLGRSTELDVARALGASRVVMLNRTVEIDTVRSVALHKVIQLVRVVELNLARSIGTQQGSGQIVIVDGDHVDLVEATYGTTVRLMRASSGLVVVQITSSPGQKA